MLRVILLPRAIDWFEMLAVTVPCTYSGHMGLSFVAMKNRYDDSVYGLRAYVFRLFGFAIWSRN